MSLVKSAAAWRAQFSSGLDFRAESAMCVGTPVVAVRRQTLVPLFIPICNRRGTFKKNWYSPLILAWQGIGESWLGKSLSNILEGPLLV